MNLTLTAARLGGSLPAIPSKSQAHRLLICAALAEAPTEIRCSRISEDMEATADCLRSMGAAVYWREGHFTVYPIDGTPHGICRLCCRESGSTLRFLLPLCGALGLNACFHMEGRLPQRPTHPLTDALAAHGMELRQEGNLLTCRGRLQSGDYAIAGNISSQFLTGLLLALPLLPGDSTLRLTTEVESRPYLDLTLETLAYCGVTIREDGGVFYIPGNQRPKMPPQCSVEGDWSDAAVFLCAGAIAGPVTVTGLRTGSTQGDRAILDLLRRFGAQITVDGNAVTAAPAPLRGITVDAAATPDLVPALAAVGAAAQGETRIENAARLRLKESDRLAAMYGLLERLGGEAVELADGLIVRGCGRLRGGDAGMQDDHRIAMAAALCSLICDGPVTLRGGACTAKSHPDFWRDFASLRKEQ